MSAKEDAGSGAEDLRRRVEEIRAKQARGEDLTMEEAGVLGAAASIRSTNEEREEAKEEGRLEEFKEEHRVGR